MIVRLEHTANFSARLIQFWMFIDALWHFKKPTFTYNHALIQDDSGVFEAIDKGVVYTGLSTHYSQKKYKLKFRDKSIYLGLTEREEEKAIAYLISQVGKKYEYSNFLFHPIKTITGKWEGEKTDNRHYCYELVIRALNASGKYNLDPFMNPVEFEEQFNK